MLQATIREFKHSIYKRKYKQETNNGLITSGFILYWNTLRNEKFNSLKSIVSFTIDNSYKLTIYLKGKNNENMQYACKVNRSNLLGKVEI